MKRIIIVHGWGGGPDKDWLSWAATEFQKMGYGVVCSNMPNTDNPTIEEWVTYLSKAIRESDKETYFIGHSIGCQAILRYLETVDNIVGGAIFVAGWFNLENMESVEEENIATPWLTTPINFEKIRKVLPKSVLIISDNDPYGAFEYNKQKFKELGSEIVVLNNAGHITTQDGFKDFPLLIETFQKNFNNLQFMTDIEKYKQQLEQEGFTHVYEWEDAPNTIYSEHVHKGKVALFVIAGLVTFSGGISKTVVAGERFDVPPGVKHTALAGPEGCTYVVGEEIKGDS